MPKNYFILAPSAEIAKTIPADITIEAEYGSVVIEGNIYTAAHHQAGMENVPAPCNDPNIPVIDKGIVLVSHLDLDTFGGCLRTCSGFTELFDGSYKDFWNLAHFVDVNGPHKLGESGASSKDLLRLYAFWAWKKENVPRLSRDEQTDITHLVMTAGNIIELILEGDARLIRAGKEMMREEFALNETTFQEVRGEVIVRRTDEKTGFCNHLYTNNSGKSFKAVAAYNVDHGTITISLADPIEGVSCREVMQDLFGPEAGGHDGIAGSPREVKMSPGLFERAVNKLAELVH